MAERVIEIQAFFGKTAVGKEECPKGTNVDHIMSKMIQKYGQVASFVVVIPPVVEMKNDVF